MVSNILIKKGKSVSESLFKEYDIRGKVGTELVLEEVYALGQAIAYYYLSKVGSSMTVVVGKDGRTHSPFIAQELIRALRDSGISVVDLGLCPTPIMYFSLHVLPVDAGLMVTASHNNEEYNGIKLCIGKEALWGPQIQKIKEFFQAKKGYKASVAGTYKELSMVERYTSWLAQQFRGLKNMPIPLVIDCAQGAAGPSIKVLHTLLGWESVDLINETVDGTFACHEPDPTVEKNMHQLKERVIKKNAHFGIGFDGDGDRMAVILSSGELVPGDKLVALFAQSIVRKRKGSSVVCDVKCSRLVHDVITTEGSQCYRSPSGHSLIKHHMRTKNALFGGEYSCHFFFKDRYFGYDDGIYAAFRLCELILESGKRLEDLLGQFPSYVSSPEIRIACAIEVRDKLIESAHNFFGSQKEASLSTIDGVQAILPYGWGLVRSSHTQPEICLRFESHTHEGLARIKKDFYHILKDHINPHIVRMSLDIQ
jgi:phosphomannomutase / phosphoglucomutase